MYVKIVKNFMTIDDTFVYTCFSAALQIHKFSKFAGISCIAWHIHANKNRINRSPCICNRESGGVCVKQMQISSSLFGEYRRKKISLLIEISVWTKRCDNVRHVSRILTRYAWYDENNDAPLHGDKMCIAMMQCKQRVSTYQRNCFLPYKKY